MAPSRAESLAGRWTNQPLTPRHREALLLLLLHSASPTVTTASNCIPVNILPADGAFFSERGTTFTTAKSPARGTLKRCTMTTNRIGSGVSSGRHGDGNVIRTPLVRRRRKRAIRHVQRLRAVEAVAGAGAWHVTGAWTAKVNAASGKGEFIGSSPGRALRYVGAPLTKGQPVHPALRTPHTHHVRLLEAYITARLSR